MIYVLTAVLLLAILLFASGIYRLERTRADYEGTWDRVEFMRDEVRQALRTLDDMRHDRSNEGLRASKRQLEAQRQ